jgi:hypothetical protein
MWGAKTYLLAASAIALGLGALWTLLFVSKGSDSLLFALAGWVPIALIGVLGGALTVAVHGRTGVAFPLTLSTCILLRLFFGLGGVALASIHGQVGAYLTALLGTFFVMQVFEMVWFIRRARVFREIDATAAR